MVQYCTCTGSAPGSTVMIRHAGALVSYLACGWLLSSVLQGHSKQGR